MSNTTKDNVPAPRGQDPHEKWSPIDVTYVSEREGLTLAQIQLQGSYFFTISTAEAKRRYEDGTLTEEILRQIVEQIKQQLRENFND